MQKKNAARRRINSGKEPLLPGLKDDDILMLSVGELNKNKNHVLVIRALAMIKNVNLHYAVAGAGEEEKELKTLAFKLGLGERVHVLGFQSDIDKWYRAADFYIIPSMREGLNVSLMEAMAWGLPCAASSIRGNTDLIDENGGALFDSKDASSCAAAIENIISRNAVSMGEYNRKKIKRFSMEEVDGRMRKIYEYFIYERGTQS